MQQCTIKFSNNDFFKFGKVNLKKTIETIINY